VLPIRADVSNEADVVRTCREVLQAFGHLDILVNNAGIGSSTCRVRSSTRSSRPTSPVRC
jgi:NAD(P)-dependent dehydrogenase (short-subunit alcohol dehydrogenase family)